MIPMSTWASASIDADNIRRMVGFDFHNCNIFESIYENIFF